MKAFKEARILKQLVVLCVYVCVYAIVASIMCVYISYNERNITLSSCPDSVLWMEQIPRFIYSKY